INPIKVEAPNIEGVLTRYVAWHSVEASIQPKERETMQGIQGILQYCSDRRVLQRLILRSGAGEPSKMAFRYQGKLYGDNQGTSYGLGLGNVNGRKGKMALSGFSIVLTLRDQSEIEIPVENDELQIAKAKGPTTINWEAAK
ncbi:MAG TPA: hypothetical protein VEF04_00705, partial [Blastocatellia bacterium]|nr:hypothetical protein [Blastocatellia bacterium]